jgi:hypothetical protein
LVFLPPIISRKETNLSENCTLGNITSTTMELVVDLFFLPSVISRKENNLSMNCTLGITSTTTELFHNITVFASLLTISLFMLDYITIFATDLAAFLASILSNLEASSCDVSMEPLGADNLK